MCPDCKGTGKYQPMFGPEEPCRTCGRKEFKLSKETYTKQELIDEVLSMLPATSLRVRTPDGDTYTLQFDFDVASPTWLLVWPRMLPDTTFTRVE